MTDDERYSAPGDTPPAEPQPTWAGPGGQTPATTASSTLDPKLGGLLAYLFGWVSGLVIYLTQRDREVRFHAAQSILFSGLLTVVGIAVNILGALLGGFLGLLLSLAYLLVALGSFALWIYLMVSGYSQKHVKLPVIGDVAEQWAVK